MRARYRLDTLEAVDLVLVNPCGWYVGGLMWVITIDTLQLLPALDPSMRTLHASIPAEKWHRLPAVVLVRLGWGFGGGSPLFYVVRREIVPSTATHRRQFQRGIVPFSERMASPTIEGN